MSQHCAYKNRVKKINNNNNNKKTLNSESRYNTNRESFQFDLFVWLIVGFLQTSKIKQ